MKKIITLIFILTFSVFVNQTFAMEKEWSINNNDYLIGEEMFAQFNDEGSEETLVIENEVVKLKRKDSIPIAFIVDGDITTVHDRRAILEVLEEDDYDDHVVKYMASYIKNDDEHNLIKVSKINESFFPFISPWHTMSSNGSYDTGNGYCIKANEVYIYAVDDCSDNVKEDDIFWYSNKIPYLELEEPLFFEKNIDTFSHTIDGIDDEDENYYNEGGVIFHHPETEDPADQSEGELLYQVSYDDGETWKYWNGNFWSTVEDIEEEDVVGEICSFSDNDDEDQTSAWSWWYYILNHDSDEEDSSPDDESDGCIEPSYNILANKPQVINKHIHKLTSEGGLFKWRAYFKSNGFQNIVLRNINVIYDTDEHPTDILINNTSEISVDEGRNINSIFGTLTTKDLDSEDIHQYSFVEGEGSEDNDKFRLFGDKIMFYYKFDYDHPIDDGDGLKNNTYSIRLKTDDKRGGIFEKIFIIKVRNLDFYNNSQPIQDNVFQDDLFLGTQCNSIIHVNQNLALGDINGVYSSRLQSVVEDVILLKMHLKRLGLYADSMDIVFNRNLFNAVKKMQAYLGINQTGKVDFRLRSFINKSCGYNGPSLLLSQNVIDNYIGDNYIQNSSDEVVEFNQINNNEEEVEELENPFNGEQCQSVQIVHSFMKKGDRDGFYSSYNKGIVNDIHILQAHMNRLLLDDYGMQASGPIDGVFGKLTERGVMRLQMKLNQLLPNTQPLKIDGIVGPRTISAINFSC